jgi:orotidine-5'-phosphate decarboxylase
LRFTERIQRRIESQQSPLVVGLDPHWNLLPASITALPPGEELLLALENFLWRVVDASHPYACAFKPQLAFFERLGPAGLAMLGRLLQRLEREGLPVILDGKRNDIGSTAAAYADAFFSPQAPWPCHALTVNGFLGGDGIEPFLNFPDHGLFVLVKTSNPGSGDLQDLRLADGRMVCEAMADLVSSWNRDRLDDSGYGPVGAVIGATWPNHMTALRARLPHSLILVPGFGAQGGEPAALRAAFKPDGRGALVNSSRAICFPDTGAPDHACAVSAAARLARDQIRACLP